MAVLIIDKLKQKNDADFAIVDSSDVQGGHHEVADNTARDALPASLRTHGMMVFVQSSGLTYVLGADLTTWTEFTSGGAGDVAGPASSTDNAIARFDSTTGKLLQNSAVTVDDSGNIATTGTVDGRDLSTDGSKLDTITVANIPSTTEKAALAGSSGTPGAGNTYVTDADARMTNARTPSAHTTSHQHGGSDEVATATPAANAIPKAGAGGTLAIGFIPLGSSGSTVTVGNDARLSDARTPTSHAASHKGGGADVIDNATTTVAGLMSGADKTKLDAVASGAAALTPAAPENVTKATAVVGVATTAARADHKHDVATASASSLTPGGSNSEGSSTSLARADHTHALPAYGSSAATIAQGDDSRFPTAGQKQALVGTAGTPGTANPFVTTTDERLGAKATADIVLSVTTTGNDSDASRPTFITGGDYSAFPYLTIQAAVNDCARQLGNQTVLISIGAGSFAGLGVRGFVGPSFGVVLRGTWSLATLTTGPNSFTAGTGTTATSLKRNGGVAWTTNNLRNKIVKVTSGAGFSDALVNEGIGVIKSNDGDTALIEGIGVFGMDNTSVVQIVNAGTRIATGIGEPSVGISVFGNVADLILSRLRIAFTDATFYGLVSSSNGCQIVVEGCSLGSGFHYLANDSYHYWNNNVLEDGANIYFDNVKSIASYGIVAGDATLDVSKFASAVLDYNNFLSAAGNALKVYRGVFAMIGLTANNCTATPLVMQNIHNMQLGANGVSGTNAGTTRGIEVSDSGQFALQGSTLAGSDPNQVSIEGTAISYTTLGLQGTARKRGTVVHWGDGRERMLQRIFVPFNPLDPGDEISTDGDGYFGGRLKTDGKLTPLGLSGGRITAAGSDQATATQLKFLVSNIIGGTGGVRLASSGIGAGDGTVPCWGVNRSGVSQNLYPPVGGTLNGGTIDAPITLPDNAFFFATSEGDLDFELTILTPGGGGGGSVATDTIFNAKGDLPVGTGSDTAARLAVGANGTILTADSAESTGLRWGTAPVQLLSGTATLSFGATPGNQIATTVVTGQTDILAGSRPIAWISDATSDHPISDAAIAGIKLYITDVVAGVGFTIVAVSDFNVVGDFAATWSTGGSSAPPINTPLTTKGDILAYSTATDRLPIGSDDRVLIADSTQPFGMRWGSPTGVFDSLLGPKDVTNLGLAVSASAGALTLALKQADGSTDPTSSGPVSVAMRNASAGVGGLTKRQVVGALSLSIPSGTTLGFKGGQANSLWAYLVDSDGAGTMKLAVSPVRVPTTGLLSTVTANKTVTMTIATPCVVTESSHGRNNGDSVTFSTTGALPTGVVAGTTYWLSDVTANTYRLNSSPGGAATGGAVINSSGGQSGVHTVKTVNAFGKLVSDAVYTNRPARLVARLRHTLVTPGTWLTASEVALDEIDSEAVSAIYNTSDATSHANGTQTIIIWNGAELDTHNAFSGTGSWFQAPVSGKYQFSIQICNNLSTWSADSYFAMGVFVNIVNSGTQTFTLGEYTSGDAPGSSIYSNCFATRDVDLVAGDFVNIAMINGSGGSIALDGYAIDNWVSIKKVG